MEKVPKVTLYAYLFKPNPPNMVKNILLYMYNLFHPFWSPIAAFVYCIRRGCTRQNSSVFCTPEITAFVYCIRLRFFSDLRESLLLCTTKAVVPSVYTFGLNQLV